MKIKLGMISVALLMANTVNAEVLDTNSALGSNANFIFTVGYTDGGEKLAGFDYYDGSSETVKSGSGVYFGGGGTYRFESTPFSLKGLVAYHFDSVTAEVYGSGEADIDFSRVEVDLLGQYHMTDNLFLGGGITRHLGVELDYSLGESIEFDSALGYVFELGYRFETVALSARYTGISYANEYLAGSIDGNSIGVFIDVYL